MSRLPLFLLLGILVGTAFGLLYAWGIQPRPFEGVAPSALRPDFQDHYLELIASAYDATGDLGRARARLALFPSVGPAALADLARQAFASHGADSSVRGLATLSASLARSTGGPPSVLPSSQPSASPTLSAPLPLTLAPSPTYLPQASASPTAPALFTLVGKNVICDPAAQIPLLETVITASDGSPLPAVEVRVRWEGGGDHFFTGLMPEKGLGYADFEMTPGVTYKIQVGASQEWITGLSAPACPQTNGTSYPGSLLLSLESK